MFNIVFSKEAQKQVYQLPKEIQVRVISTLERIRIRPYHYIKKIVGCPYFRLRVGDYRVIFEIQQDKLIIYVVELGHRRNIYQKFN